ncbi:MAG: molybdopterin-dependent oxidoreductase [Anaerolineales bacterium]|nr:molybdopterin-dependent oxidoreductase [Anaerolineales bacterium]
MPAPVALSPTLPPVEPTAEPAPIEPAPTEPALAGPVVLTVVGPEETLALTMEELQNLPVTSGQAGMKSSTGKITVPAQYSGVLLKDLIERVGGLSAEYGVSIVAEDGYAMTLSYDQITSGGFITYDPSDGSEKQIDGPLQALVAYAVDGEPLNKERDGTLRLVIISERNNQVTDGHWSVKWVERIEMQPLVREWSLSLAGIGDEVIDRNTFQSCAAASCHQSTWTDDEDQVWSGVPVYLLAGRVDDEITHEGPAYNRDLANIGYLIELIASDGYTTTVSSADTYYNRQILVAYLVDGSPLPDRYFPLRLVGEALKKNQRVGSLTEIRLTEIDAEATTVKSGEQPTKTVSIAETPDGTTLWITGQVINSLALNDAALRSLGIIQITAEHPKKGSANYEGVNLNALLGFASPLPGTATIVLTAADGYSTNLDLAAVQACPDCLVAFTETDGIYSLVMPGFESSAWLKNLVKIEIR